MRRVPNLAMQINTNCLLGSGLAMLVGCTSPSDAKLPSLSFTPHLESSPTGAACGDDVTLAGDPAPFLRYSYTYDAADQLVHAQGVLTGGGPDDSVDYGYDSAGNFVHMLDAWDTTSSEIAASYDGSNNLVTYSWEATAPDYHDRWDYAMSDFGASGPTRETVTEQGGAAFVYQLVYDGDGRLVQAIPDTGDATSYSYDDAARTITIDTGNGAFTDVITYNESFAELGDVWDGSDASVIAGSEVYAWSGDQLVSATYSSGTADAPHQVSVVETDTVRYDCAAAKKRASGMSRTPAIRHHERATAR